MKISIKIIYVLLFTCASIYAQNDTIIKDTIQLKEVLITSNRISIPFSESSRTINLISTADIVASSTTNVADLLQNVAGVDVRRREIGRAHV